MSIYIDEMKELQLYNRKFYIPIDKSNKRKGSCILLLSPDYKGSEALISNPNMINLNLFESYYIEKNVNFIINGSNFLEESVILEDKLKASERTDFGLPEKKKYPMPDKDHVLAAIRMFNHVDKEDEAELARNINKKIKQYGMKKDVNVGEKNRFYKYFHEEVLLSEASFKDTEKVFNSLSNEDKKFVSPRGYIVDSPNLLIREVEYSGKNPVGYIEVYRYNGKSTTTGFIGIAVRSDYRGKGVAKRLLTKAIAEAKKIGLSKLIYKLDAKNDSSKRLIESLGYKLSSSTKNSYTYNIDLKAKNESYEVLSPCAKILNEDLVITEDYIADKDYLFIMNEAKNNYSSLFRKMLFNERLKTNKEITALYDKVVADIPIIKRTYLRLDLYKGYNLFVDWSYYSELFFKHLALTKDKALNLYFEFLNRFITDGRLESNGYLKKTVFVSINDWKVAEGSELWDYTKNINPISMIYRFIKSNNTKLAKYWNSIDFVFLGNNGFFKVRMENLNKTNLQKFINNIKRIKNSDSIIDNDKTDSADAITTSIINDIEKGTNIKVYNLTGSNKSITGNELREKISDAITSDSQEQKKEALVDAIKYAASKNTNIEDTYKDINNDDAIKRLIVDLDANSEDGVKFSAARLNRINTLSDDFMNKTINGSTVKDLISSSNINTQIPKRSLNIDSIDDEWNNLSFINFEEAYDVNQDIMAILASFSEKSIPLAVRDIKVEDISTSEDMLYLYHVEFEDAYGKRSKIDLEVPKFKNNRYMRLRGNDKIVSGQLLLLPIIKTDEDTVQIVSNYNKIFIRRYGTNTGKSYVNTDRLIKALNKLEASGNTNIKISYGDNTRICSKYDLPIDYIDLASVYNSIEFYINGDHYKFFFNQDELKKEYPNLELDSGALFNFGVLTTHDKKVHPIFYKDGILTDTILNYLSLVDGFIEAFDNTSESVKYTYSQASILNTRLPLIVVMAYSEGLQTALKKANVTYEVLDKRQKYDKKFQDIIRFKDGYILYDLNYNSSLLMNGLKECNTEDYSIKEINNKAMWVDFLDIFGSKIIADGLDNFYDLMIDPITKQTCIEYKLPTDYISILAYANNLLTNNRYNRHIDITGNRLRTNEIVAGYVYKVLSKAYGDYQRQIKRNRKEASMSCKRSSVVDAILLDPTESDASSINPLLDREAASAVSFKGLSGMNNDRSYGLDKRTYDESMNGVLAMSTGFAANVGLTRWTTIDANVAGKRGYIKQTSKKDMSDTKTLSMTEALTPFGTTSDDPFRTAMTFIQTSKHGMRVQKGCPMLVSNGADEALAYVTGDTFAFKAKKKGTVKEITNDYIIVEYEDKTKDFVDLREKIRKNSDGGFFIVVKLDTNVHKGQKIKPGDILAYDKLSYSNEVGDPDHLAYNVGCLAKVAILVTDEGFEDSAIIDDGLSEMMSSDIVVKKDVKLDKRTNVYNLLKPGTVIQEGDPLIIFQNSYEEEDANALLKTLSADEAEINELGRISIRSKVSGVVQDVKLYRTVELNELSPSLKKLFTEYENNIKKIKSVMQKNNIDTSELDSDYKLDATGKLKNAEDGVLIEFYLKYHDKMSVGDKLVYYSALKGVVKDIFPKGQEPYTERRPKEKIRSFLTATSINKRMVGSVIKVGSIQKVLIELDRKVKDILNIKYNDNL